MNIDIDFARWAIEGILIALAVVLWFLMRSLIGDVKKIGKDFSDHKLHVSETYARKTEFTSAIERLTTEMREGFNRLFDKLDGKADK